MQVRTVVKAEAGVEMLCGFVFADTGEPPVFDGIEDDPNLASAIRQSAGDMAGRSGKIVVVPVPLATPAKRILLAGLGKSTDVTPDLLRHVSGKIAKEAASLKLGEFHVVLPARIIDKMSEERAASVVAEGAVLSMYSFDKFKSDGDDGGNYHGSYHGNDNGSDSSDDGATTGEPDLVIIINDGQTQEAVSDAVRTAVAVSEGTVFVRSVANLPPNECSPDTLACIANEIADTSPKLKCTVISKNDLKSRGFGGITAVGQGSRNEPNMIILEYRGCGNYNGGDDDDNDNNNTTSNSPTILVGKAVTFDTGGISLKPGDRMDEMKFDKCGGCTVLGIMKTVAALNLRCNVVGIVPSVENMPGGESYRPGDIIRLYSGKTAEILNTDAEGRLILADAIAYAEKHYAPRAIIDFATLTGACIVALGTNVAGMVSNNPDLADQIRESSARTDEEIWELPLNRDYMDMIKSNVADMKNMGIGRAAGTIAAAAFLRRAVQDTPWVHLDIAGVAWMQTPSKKRSYKSKGATGFGVRLIMDHLLGLD